jgi:hypothetical protein
MQPRTQSGGSFASSWRSKFPRSWHAGSPCALDRHIQSYLRLRLPRCRTQRVFAPLVFRSGEPSVAPTSCGGRTKFLPRSRTGAHGNRPSPASRASVPGRFLCFASWSLGIPTCCRLVTSVLSELSRRCTEGVAMSNASARLGVPSDPSPVGICGGPSATSNLDSHRWRSGLKLTAFLRAWPPISVLLTTRKAGAYHFMRYGAESGRSIPFIALAPSRVE